MDGVVEMADVDDPHSHTDEGDDLEEPHVGFSLRLESVYPREPSRSAAEPTLESCSPNSSSFCCRGVFSCSVAAIWSRILPISVETPVATTIPVAFPAAMFVPCDVKNAAKHVNND